MHTPKRRAAIALMGGLLLVLSTTACGDDDDTASTADTSTTEAPSTSAPTTAPTTATTAPPATTALPATTDTTAGTLSAATAVFPTLASTNRYADPVEVAQAFATEYLGFTTPVVSEFRAGDSRSGEVGIRPIDTGPESTVFVRQLEDDTWWVLGSATENIVLDAPEAGDTVTSPITLQGSALAFEGNVEVELRADDVTEPIATTFVTGGGDVARPFEGSLEFEAPAADYGAIVLVTHSAEDGSVWQAGVVRVQY